jgi:hypothetical protein
MKDGVRHGVCKQWNDKGALLGTFEMSMGTGISKQWFQNGQIEFEASIVNESFTGRLRRWSEAGELVQETFFLKNKILSEDEYDRARQSDASLPSYPERPGETSPVLIGDRSRRRSHERLVARLLSSRTASAMEWLKTDSTNSKKTLAELNTAKSIALVTAFYDAGAVDVLAVDIDEDPKGNVNADKLVIILPTDQEKRQAIRKLCARRKLQFSPDRYALRCGNAPLPVANIRSVL